MLLFQFPGVAEQWLTQDQWSNFRAWAWHPDADAVIAELEASHSLTPGLNWYRANLPPETLLTRPPALPPVRAPVLGVWSSDLPALLQRDEHLRVQRNAQEPAQRGRQGARVDPGAVQRLIHIRGRQRGELLHVMALGVAAWPGDAGQLGEPGIDLQIEGPAGQQHPDRQGARLAEGLRDGLEPRRVPARPGTEGVHLIQHQQRGPARCHP